MASSSLNHAECYPFQLMDGDGKLNDVELDSFLGKVNLSKSGDSYVVASIIGPQSSGKSTLLNKLFGTDFKEMNAALGKNQTTKGIWMANCQGIKPHTLIMDVEGNDGQERGQDDTTFEKQCALFSLVVSNIVIVNMWYSDVGRDSGANKPLLRVVFQAMVTMFKTNKVTLLFVIRDANAETPFSVLETNLKKGIQEIWKPIAPEKALLGDFFNVEVVPLAHFKYQKDQFIEDVAKLRKRFFNSLAPGELASGKESLIPASGFSYSTKSLWETIKENKELDIPSHKELVATTLCEKIANEKFAWFAENEAWHKVQKSVEDCDIIEGFGDIINSLLNTCLAEYHERAMLFDVTIRKTKQMELEARLLRLIQPFWNTVVEHIGSRNFEKFKEEFDMAMKDGKDPKQAAGVCANSLGIRFKEGCAGAAVKLAKWDISTVKDTLMRNVLDHVSYVTNEMGTLKAEREKEELRLRHDEDLARTEAAVREAAELKAALEAKAAELKAEHEAELAELKANSTASEQKGKHELEVAKLKATNDAAEATSKFEVAKLKAEKEAAEATSKYEVAKFKAEMDAAEAIKNYETKLKHQHELDDVRRSQQREFEAAMLKLQREVAELNRRVQPECLIM